MILTVTLNPALDLTYAVDEFRPQTTHRVRAVHERAGGKGLNVASVLHAQGEPVLATGLLGGVTGERVRELLAAADLPHAFAPIAGETRRTVTIADGVDATGLWEPGPDITTVEWLRFLQLYRMLLDDVTVVAMSGSLPRGLPADAYAVLIDIARVHGACTVLDTSGEPLRLGLVAGPDVVKPNAEELAVLMSERALPDEGTATDQRTVLDVRMLRRLGAGCVVVSRGPDGLLAVSGHEGWRAAPPAPETGNPTGAGDACVAALARGLRDRTPWPELLADAVALSAAAVAAPVAGAVDEQRYRDLRTRINVVAEPLTGVVGECNLCEPRDRTRVEQLDPLNEHPAAGSEHLAVADEHPGGANEHPGVPHEHPGVPNEHPGVANERPEAANGQPAVAYEHPRTADEHPGFTDEHSAGTHEHPRAAGEDRGVASERPGFTNEQDPSVERGEPPC
ncbi:1-phosphofructokinase family hexose kinase [Dactylosporangium sp. NPDC049140]|uniref:1-phosphofructokinase family hexose kinase n=1 Tax=Dactylosporangium sp. NPDC049140 TaxID=3155647 RepID=UPI0033D48A7F